VTDLQRFDHKPPETQAKITAIQKRGLVLAQTAQTVANLGLEGVDVQVQIAGLFEISTHCTELARNIGMHAIAEGKLSQNQLARLMHVAPLTVGRWVKAAQEQEDQ
jgi:hypothetical protein